MPSKAEPVTRQGTAAIRCFACPCGCVCLRWHETLLLHFDSLELNRAVACLEDILLQPACAFSLGDGPFCACRAADGNYYLMCQEQVVLRLSEDDARNLHAELAYAQAQMSGLSSGTAQRSVM